MHTSQEASKILHSLTGRQQHQLLRDIPFAWTCFQVGIFASVFLPMFAGGLAKHFGAKAGYSTIWALIPVSIVMIVTFALTMFGMRWVLVRHIARHGLPVEFPCAHCARVLRFAGSAVGKQGKCPQCGTIQVIPGLAPIVGGKA